MSIFLTIISSLLMSLSINYKPFSFLAWIGLIPFYYSILNGNQRKQKIIFQGFIFGLIYNFSILYWIFSLYPLNYLNLSNTISIIIITLGYISISFIESLFFALTFFIFTKIKKNSIIDIFSISFLFVIQEWLQSLGPLAFPWGTFSISQSFIPVMAQCASLLGSLFLTFLISTINGLFAYFIFTRKKKYIYSSLIALLSIFLFGIFNMSFIKSGKPFTYCLVQGNISSYQKWNPDSITDNKLEYESLSTIAIRDGIKKYKGIDLLIWPETAVPITANDNEHLMDDYRKIANTVNDTFIFGTFHKDNNFTFNSLYNISREGYVNKPYSKRKLVPFGEFIPFRKFIISIFPKIDSINMFSNIITPGQKISLIPCKSGNGVGVICFESIFNYLPRESVLMGGNFIIDCTNDSWFKDSKELDQHFRHSILRGIEENRWVLRVGNTGVSAVVSNKGVIKNIIQDNTRGYLIGIAESINSLSLYSYLGNILIPIAIIYTFIIYIKK